MIRPQVVTTFGLVLATLCTEAFAETNCKEGVRPGPDVPAVATKTVTGTDSGAIRVGVGGPVYVHVVNKGPAASLQVIVRKPGASLVKAICNNGALLDEDQDLWLQVYFVGDHLERDVEVLTGVAKAKLEVTVYKGVNVLPPTTPKDRVTIRLRAFIPNTFPANPSYARRVPGTSEQVMISGPFADATAKLGVNLANDCFLTDNRGFSGEKNASSRVETEFNIVVYYGQVSIEPVSDGGVHRAAISTKLSCADGKVVERKQADFNGLKGVRALGKPSVADGRIQIAGQAASSNPHVAAAPSIDYSFDLIYDTKTHELAFKLTAGDFPAFEAYAIRNGKTVTLTKQEPKSETAWGLLDGGLGLNMQKHEGTAKL